MKGSPVIRRSSPPTREAAAWLGSVSTNSRTSIASTESSPWQGPGDRVGASRDKCATHPEHMQLHIARLCLDCDEVHVAERCPVCGSDAFAYLTRWIPAAERRMCTRPTTSPEADVYRRLIDPTSPPPRLGRLLRRSALGVTVVAVASWVWRWSEGRKRADTPPSEPPCKSRENQTLA
jgi:hypothetical protein